MRAAPDDDDELWATSYKRDVTNGQVGVHEIIIILYLSVF